MKHFNVAILIPCGGVTRVLRLRLRRGADVVEMDLETVFLNVEAAYVCQQMEDGGADVVEADTPSGPVWVATRMAGWQPSAWDVADALAGKKAFSEVDGPDESPFDRHARMSNSGPDTPLSAWESYQLKVRRG